MQNARRSIFDTDYIAEQDVVVSLLRIVILGIKTINDPTHRYKVDQDNRFDIL